MSAAADILRREIEGGTICARVRYRLKSTGAAMTSTGLAEGLGISPRESINALEAHIANGLVDKRSDAGPRPLYRWIGAADVSKGALERVEASYQQRAEAQAQPPPAPKPPEATEPDPIKVAADAALARANATARAAPVRKPEPDAGPAAPTLRSRIRAVFGANEVLSNQEIAARLTGNTASVGNMLWLMRHAGELVQVSRGRYRLRAPAASTVEPEKNNIPPAAAPSPEPEQAPAAAPAPEPVPEAAVVDQAAGPAPGASLMIVLDLDNPGLFAGAAWTALKLGHRMELRLGPGGQLLAATADLA
ncbi:MAG TPA: hypothetical protein VFA75_16330 [Nevskia sp.]|nr:hypothetical protein [Nevskia sp.]